MPTCVRYSLTYWYNYMNEWLGKRASSSCSPGMQTCSQLRADCHGVNAWNECHLCRGYAISNADASYVKPKCCEMINAAAQMRK
mmetsp:Transcript_3174/g.7551  ORF Transcript_3174/g.7551 Transcript_3174/m.7551 type:complete len:84 (-) Transcript_3174:679-930(-)